MTDLVMTRLRRLAPIMAAAAVVAAAAGCGGSPSGSPAGSASGAPDGGTPAADRTSASPSPSRPSARPLPKAADGRRLGACSDGTCEVLLRRHDTIRPPSRYGMEKVTVTKLGGGLITLYATTSGGYLRMQGPPGGSMIMNDWHIRVVAIQGDEAVVRFGS